MILVKFSSVKTSLSLMGTVIYFFILSGLVGIIRNS